jgi:PQQ-dependent dehydrogenase (s-GDH family)
MRTATRTLIAATLTAIVASTSPATAAHAGDPGPGQFTTRVIATGLANPFEVANGPDGLLWVTERSAGRVVRINPATGARSTALTLPDVLVTPGTQDGLMGMALHPELLTARNQHVFLAYTYDADPGTAVDRRVKLVRYFWEQATQRLILPITLIEGLPGSDDHNSGRLVFGPDGKLAYTIGDGGHNQFANYCKPIRAQRTPTAQEVRNRDWVSYQGKVLRLNVDGTIPADNPVINGVRSHVYSLGHRNPQGLTYGPGGRLYSNEHGPKNDDEINLVRAAGNYGWPNISGYKDDQAYVYANWSAAPGCPSLPWGEPALPQVPQSKESSFTAPNLVDPLRTYYTVGNDFNFQDPKCAAAYYICWPGIAPSSLDYLPASRLSGWSNSLLMTTLKDGTIYRVPLTADGQLKAETIPVWKSVNRYRDLTFNATGTVFYAVTDSSGLARDPLGAPTNQLTNPGTLLEYAYNS